MAGDYPRLLVDRDAVVIRDGQAEQTRLRGWLDGYDGPVPTYRIELVTREGTYTCPYTATGPDMFEALVRLRRQLEPDGLMVAVQGSRRDTYPSGMARDMGGGMQVYVMRAGRSARQEDLVEPLGDASPDQITTVDEQRAFAEAWWAEPRKQCLTAHSAILCADRSVDLALVMLAEHHQEHGRAIMPAAGAVLPRTGQAARNGASATGSLRRGADRCGAARGGATVGLARDRPTLGLAPNPKVPMLAARASGHSHGIQPTLGDRFKVTVDRSGPGA
jgi:hypothetical protein